MRTRTVCRRASVASASAQRAVEEWIDGRIAGDQQLTDEENEMIDYLLELECFRTTGGHVHFGHRVERAVSGCCRLEAVFGRRGSSSCRGRFSRE